MRNTLIFLFLFCSFAASAGDDPIYYDQNWQPVKKKKASYYRIATTISDSLFKTDDYYMFGKLYRTGFRTTLEDEGSRYRTGHYVYYDSAGNKLREGDFSNGNRSGKWVYYAVPSGKVVREEHHHSFPDADTSFDYYREENVQGMSVTLNHNIIYQKMFNADSSYRTTTSREDTFINTSYYSDGTLKAKNISVSGKLLSFSCYGKDGMEKPCDTVKKRINSVVNKGGKRETTEDGRIMTFVEQMPAASYDYNKYLAKNVVYPKHARDANIEGRVVIKFIVEEDGSISDVYALKKVDPSIDSEAVRVVSSFPPWLPGRQNGTPVRVYFTLPIVFKLK